MYIGQGRNFALNPNEGLKISPFKDAHTARAAQDRELDKLAHYLIQIAGIQDFRTVNHKVCLLRKFHTHLTDSGLRIGKNHYSNDSPSSSLHSYSCERTLTK